MNRLGFYDANDSQEILGSHGVLVTGPGHPYVDHYWPPGHIIGYEHTFISALADFLDCLSAGRRFHPDFDDAVEVQKVLGAVEESAATKSWVTIG